MWHFGVFSCFCKKKKKNTTDESHENKAVRLLQNLRCRLQVWVMDLLVFGPEKYFNIFALLELS